MRTAIPKASRTSTPRRRRRSVGSPVPNAGRRVVVTGATGLVGQRVLPHLRQRGWEIVAVERRLRPATSIPGTIQLTADLRSPGWQSWCQGCTALLHLAGSRENEFTHQRRDSSSDRLMATNLASACVELGISRVIMLSALGAGSGAATEFHRAKWQAEAVVSTSAQSWTIVRVPPLFGPGDRWSLLLTTVLQRLPLFPISGDGSSRLQPLAVDELASLLVDVLEQPDTAREILEVGGPEVLSYKELLHRTARAAQTRFRPLFLPQQTARWLLPLAGKIARIPLTRGPLALLPHGGVVHDGQEGLQWRAHQRYQGPTWLNGGH